MIQSNLMEAQPLKPLVNTFESMEEATYRLGPQSSYVAYENYIHYVVMTIVDFLFLALRFVLRTKLCHPTSPSRLSYALLRRVRLLCTVSSSSDWELICLNNTVNQVLGFFK